MDSRPLPFRFDSPAFGLQLRDEFLQIQRQSVNARPARYAITPSSLTRSPQSGTSTFSPVRRGMTWINVCGTGSAARYPAPAPSAAVRAPQTAWPPRHRQRVDSRDVLLRSDDNIAGGHGGSQVASGGE
jgi:hypothetical protein